MPGAASPMNAERLRIPDVLARATDHALICTFGADFSLLEGPLWRQISRARNRIVLADDRMLARQLDDQASGGSRLRHINVNYVASPVTNPGSAHAKLILLADATTGTLLVGSGNLSMGGYASRGEVFCKYEFSAADPSQLAAFATVKEFLDLMGARGYLDAQARRHIDQLWEDVGWIWAAEAGAASPVRHNLVAPLAQQLIEAVGGEPVTDAVLHAPFYDPDCEALRRLLATLSPAHTTILLQERRTQVDPAALARVATACAAPPRVLLAEAAGFPGTYLHAKFVLIRTPTRSITLVGSANLSLAALYRTDQAGPGGNPGNIELVNLAVAGPEGFDALLSGLDLREAGAPIAEIDVSYPPDANAAEDGHRPQLQRGTWADGVLELVAAAPLPECAAALVIAGAGVPDPVTVNGTLARAAVAGEAASLLDRAAVPVWLRLDTPAGAVESTPVYPYHPIQLAGMLAGRRDPELLRTAGSLDLGEDADLTLVVEELDATLVIDRQSLWRLAPRKPSVEGPEEDGPRLRWEDIDWERLRAHPRLSQYQDLFGGSVGAAGPTGLQVVLASIAERFGPVGARRSAPGVPQRGEAAETPFDIDVAEELAGDDTSSADATPEEIESESGSEGEREKLRLRRRNANRAAWQRFCERFADAVKDSDFVDLVGPSVVVANAIVFNHLLALLVAKNLIDPVRGIEHQVRLWEFLWGDETAGGYLGSLDEQTRLAAMQVIEDHGGEVVVLGAAAVAEQHTRGAGREGLRLRVRDAWRHLLESELLAFTGPVLRKAVRGGARTATDLVVGLDRLAHESTPGDLRAALSAALGDSARAIWMRGQIHRNGRTETVDYLDLEGARLASENGLAALARWAAVDRDRDYLRIRDRDAGTVVMWDRARRECLWYDSRSHEDRQLDEPAIEQPGWSVECGRLIREAASVADGPAPRRTRLTDTPERGGRSA